MVVLGGSAVSYERGTLVKASLGFRGKGKGERVEGIENVEDRG